MDMDMNEHGESDDTNGDGEGVWSPDIEQCFREALLLFPPCGRRKHILQEEGGGKMYGRNELIARHIMMRTGKSRTRKQVSSHIQVLARRKAKAEAAGSTGSVLMSPSPNTRPHSANARVPAPDTLSPNRHLHLHHQQQQHQLQQQHQQIQQQQQHQQQQQLQPQQLFTTDYEIWADRPIVTPQIRLVEFSAFIEYRKISQQQSSAPFDVGNPCVQLALPSNNNNDINIQHQQPHHLQHHHHHQQQHLTSSGFVRHSYVQIDYKHQLSRQANKLERIDISQIQDKFPEIGGSSGLFARGPADAFFLIKFWADLNNDYEYNIEDQNSYFGFSSHFETNLDLHDITVSTKACSYGRQVVEKVEKVYRDTSLSSNGGPPHSFIISRSPMCEFMIKFIKKLRALPITSQMNSVLENFSVLQVITDSNAQILLCLAYVFEVAKLEQNNPVAGPQYNVYKLTKDSSV